MSELGQRAAYVFAPQRLKSVRVEKTRLDLRHDAKPARRSWDASPTPLQLALARGHRWLAMLESGEASSMKEIAQRERNEGRSTMGLFDFAAEFGNKLFGNDDDPSEKIKAHIESDNPGVRNLDVAYDDGKVVLSGEADSAEVVEKTVLIAGNIQGVTEVSAENIKAPDPAPGQRVEYYVIQKGDTLSKIAKQYLGNAMDYPKIFEANREVIKDPDLIYPGQKIRIPLE